MPTAATRSSRSPPVGRHPLHPREQGLFPDDLDLLELAVPEQRSPFVSAGKGNWNERLADGQPRLAGRRRRRWSMRASPRASSRAGSTAAPTTRRTSTKYDPETVWSYEAGFKTTIANQLRLNGAVFYNDYKDFQARVSGLDDDPDTGLPTPVLSVLNAGKLRIKGAELEAAWTPVRTCCSTRRSAISTPNIRSSTTSASPLSAAAARSRRRPSRPSGRCGFGGAICVRSRSARRHHGRRPDALPFAPGARRRQYARQYRRPRSKAFPGRLLARTTHGSSGRTPSKKFAVGLYGYNLANKAYKTDAQEFSSIGNIRHGLFRRAAHGHAELDRRY